MAVAYLLRYGLVLVILWSGLMKFTRQPEWHIALVCDQTLQKENRRMQAAKLIIGSIVTKADLHGGCESG